MAYVEFLRVRRSLTWHAGVLLAIMLVALSFSHDTTVSVNGQAALVPGMGIPLGMLAPIGTFFAAIYGTSLGTSLNRENAMRDISWTKPIARGAIALQYVLIDIAGVAIAFALTMLAVLAVLLRIHIAPVIDASTVPLLVLALGVGVMWYALVQVITFGLPAGGRSLSGILWPVALVAYGLGKVPGTVGDAARTLDIINPLAYIGGIAINAAGAHQEALWQLPVEARALCVWLFAGAFCAVAIGLWPHKEA